jgi:hypothetical protein
MCVLRAPGVTRIKLFADTADLFARRHSLIDWRRDFTSFSTPGRSSSSLTSVCDGAMGAKPSIDAFMSLFTVASMVERGGRHGLLRRLRRSLDHSR